MLLTCPSCKTKNFLDPYPFWNFKGTTQCAGCKKIWRLETSHGSCLGGSPVCVAVAGRGSGSRAIQSRSAANYGL